MQISLTRTEEEDEYLKKNHQEQLISCGKTYNIGWSKRKAFICADFFFCTEEQLLV